MQKILILGVIIFNFTFVSAQSSNVGFFLYYSSASKVITGIELTTGKISFTRTLKEPIFFAKEVVKKHCIYISTRHYVYKLDNITGEIMTEYQFTDVLTKEAGDYADPNINIMPPFQFTDNGIGFYYNITGEARAITLAFNKTTSNPTMEQTATYLEEHAKALNTNKIYKVDIENSTTTAYATLKASEYLSGFSPKIIDNKVYFYKYDLPNEQILIEECSEKVYTDKQIITIPITADNILGFNVTKEVIKNKSSLGSSKVYSTSLVNCFKIYESKVTCPEKKPMPTGPVFTTTGTNRKARARDAETHKQQIKEHQKKLDEWSKQQSDFSECELKLYKDSITNDNLLTTFIGVRGVTIYYDRYVIYHNGIEYVNYDLESKQELWSIGL